MPIDPVLKLSNDLDQARRAVESCLRRYLETAGWKHTCHTCHWLWRKEVDGEVIMVGIQEAEKLQRYYDFLGPLPYEGEDEHPEDWDGPCGCDTCKSYV